MALTRARPVTGSDRFRRRLEQAIAVALAGPRDPARLVADVAEMRQRIADEHPRPAAWDLRNRRGGLIDLEFIAQYLMLREAARTPAILRRDTGAALEALGKDEVLPSQAVQALGGALASLAQCADALDPALRGPARAGSARRPGWRDSGELRRRD